MLIREESYGHEDPSRDLLASEKAQHARVGFLTVILTCNVSCLASSAPSVCSGLCGEQQVSFMLRKVYFTF